MIKTFPESFPCDESVQSSKKYGINSTSFGDGYSQRSKTGINHVSKTYSPSWSALNEDEKDEIIAFFDDTEGVDAFYWTPWDVLEKEKFIVSSVKVTSYSQYFKVSAKFTLVYDLD